MMFKNRSFARFLSSQPVRRFPRLEWYKPTGKIVFSLAEPEWKAIPQGFAMEKQGRVNLTFTPVDEQRSSPTQRKYDYNNDLFMYLTVQDLMYFKGSLPGNGIKISSGGNPQFPNAEQNVKTLEVQPGYHPNAIQFTASHMDKKISVSLGLNEYMVLQEVIPAVVQRATGFTSFATDDAILQGIERTSNRQQY